MNCKGYYFAVAALFLVGLLNACADGGARLTRSDTTGDGGPGGISGVPVKGMQNESARTRFRSTGAIAGVNSVDCDSLEGRIDDGSIIIHGNTKTLSVLGMVVSVDATATTFDEGATYATLVEGEGIEIRGFYDNGVLNATRVESHADNDYDYELAGTMVHFDGFTVALKLRNGARTGSYAISKTARVDLLPYPFGRFVRIKLARFGEALQVIHIQSDDAHYSLRCASITGNETERLDNRV